MSPWDAFIIGSLQGLTEFFPVSSSAHLKLAKFFLGVERGEQQVYFDLVCHLGTLCAALYFFRRDILDLFTSQRKKLPLFFIALLPLIPFYFLLKPLREFASKPEFLGYALIFTSMILFIGQRWRIRRKEESSSKREIRDVLCIGAMQGAALIPGISRSASTISTGQILGWSSRDAVRFSFLLAIPTILGGNCMELLKTIAIRSPILTHSMPLSSYLIAFFSSCGVGLLMIGFAMRFLEKGNLKPFAWYCLILGVCVSLYMN